MNLFKKTLDEMPNVFTSNKFGEALRKNGVPEMIILKNGLYTFLSKFCNNQYHGSKTWTKKIKKNNIVVKNIINEHEAISFLKSKGYKILKNKWEEI